MDMILDIGLPKKGIKMESKVSALGATVKPEKGDPVESLTVSA